MSSCSHWRRAKLLSGLLSVLAATAVAVTASAQDAPAPAPPRAFTLSEAIAYARAHQPAVRVALRRLAARKSEADIPRAQWLPSVGATAQLLGATSNNSSASYVGGPFVLIPRIGGTTATTHGTWQPYASSLVGVTGSQELFDFGRIGAQAAAADAVAEIERQRLGVTELDVTFGVEEAYFAVLMAKAIVRTSEDAYDRSRGHRDLAKSGVGAGMRSPIELTRAEADLTRFDVGRVRAQGGLALAESVFAAAVGVPDAALDAGGTAPSPREMPSLASAVQHAQSRDPRILEMVARVRAEEASTRAIGAELRPDLGIVGALTGRAGGSPAGGDTPTGSGFVPYIPNWSVGLVLSWPLLEPMVNARRDASRAREDVRREELGLAKYEQLAAIRQAYAAVFVALSALPALERTVEAARANYAQADARFRGGLGTSVELADAEALRTDAEIQLAQGQFEVARARAAFGRSIAEGATGE